MDPNTALMVSSAVSGAAGALVQQTLTSGGSWLKDRFAGHQANAMQQAIANVNDFLDELGARVQRMEESNLALRERIADAMSHPDYSILMQRAVLAAAQTDNHDKHILLAQLVSERLRVDEDTTLARACKMACDAVENLASRQLNILGFLYTITHLQFPHPAVTSIEVSQALEIQWLVATLSPYRTTGCTLVDRMHLESVGSIVAQRGTPQVAAPLGRAMVVLPKLVGLLTSTIDPSFPYQQFIQTPAGLAAQALYDDASLGTVALTMTGSLIGMFVADTLASRPTDITAWHG